MKKKILARRIITIMLMALILTPLFPTTAFAQTFELTTTGMDLGFCADGDTILVKSGADVMISNMQGLTKNIEIVCEEGVILHLYNVMVDAGGADDRCALSFTGSGNELILSGTNTLKSGKNEPGIRVESGTALEIKDDGSGVTDVLNATGGNYGAGIGGGNTGIGGSITISGDAEVAATGGYDGAGIGGGKSGSGGSITISGDAEVTATGGYGGAGIGGGYEGDGGTITISGDVKVTAAGNGRGAGIGGGGCADDYYAVGGDGGNTTISGGTVIANGSYGSAGIGGGKSGSSGSITISGDAKVTATGGGDGAGIGGDNTGSNGSITISGDAEVTATGGDHGAGIGSGNQARCGTITISGSAQVTATGGSYGAGIGTGYNSIDNNHGTITISGSAQVTATGGYFGAGVGSGCSGRVGAVTISGGTVFTAGGSRAQDIGHGNGSDKCGLLSISGDDTAVFLKNDSTATITTSSHTRVYKRNTINGQLYGYTMPSASWTSIGAYLPDSRYYILTYDANEGTGIDADAHLPGGGPIIIGSSRFSRTCYIFVEWNTSSGGDGTPYAPGDELTMTEDTTVYAIWKEIEVENVDIRNDTEVLLPDDVVTLTAVVSPNNAFDKSLSWTSSDESVATVDSQGVVTAIGMGTATIKAETSNGVYDTCQIVVSGVLMNYELSTGSVMKMSATVLPSGTTAVWTSDNENVATVAQDGTVTAVAPGYAVITATGGSVLHQCGVAVYDQAVTSVQLNRTSVDLMVNDTAELTAYVFPDDAVNKDVIWTSDNEDVATVSDSGTVTAVGKGSATITAKSGGPSASCTVEVTLPVASVSISPSSKKLSLNETADLNATVSPSDATDADVTWTSSDESIATVDSTGTVTAKSFGSAAITAEADGQFGICIINVVKTDVTNVSLSSTSETMGKSDTLMLRTTVSPSSATYPDVTWKSSDTDIVTVDGTGKITAVGYGSATVTAEADGKFDTCTVTVVKTEVTSVGLSSTSETLAVGDTVTLVATVSPSDAMDAGVTWTSTNPSVATVDAHGKVTAVAEGATSVISKAGTAFNICTVLVSSGLDASNGSDEDDTPPSFTPSASSEPADKNEDEPDTVIITIVVSQLPEGTAAIRLPNGELVEFDGSDTLEVEVGSEYLSGDGSVELVALDEEGTPLGVYDADGIIPPDTGNAGAGVWPVLLWVLIGIAGAAVIGGALYLTLRKRRAS